MKSICLADCLILQIQYVQGFMVLNPVSKNDLKINLPVLEGTVNRTENITLLIIMHLRPHVGGVRENHAVHAQYRYSIFNNMK